MRKLSLSVLLCLFGAWPAAAQTDEPGSKDHPLIARMAGFYIGGYKANDFDKFDFQHNADGDQQSVEGKFWQISYWLKEGAKRPSPLEILRNHRNAFAKAGGRQLYVDDNVISLRVDKPATMWAHVTVMNDGEMYELTIVQPAAMSQQLELTAEGIAKQLEEQGRVVLHNILFDTGTYRIKRPDSEPPLAMIAAVLKDDPSLRVEIQGHTDNVGSPATNQKLSQDRAESVKNWLVTRHGIDPSRLTTTGFGDTKPMGDNKTEEGRAQNRRVELVRK